MKKKLLCLIVALGILCASAALADGSKATFALRFDEGFSLSLPEGWVSYPVRGDAIRYALGDGKDRYLYILAQDTDLREYGELQAAIEGRGDCGKTSPLDLNGQPFAAFIASRLNASGCSTLLNGEIITFLFTPQDDSEYMLTVAEIMASFRTVA